MRIILRAFVAASICFAALPAVADGNLHHVNHVVIIMQENHSFDNYFGVLPYVPSGPYHAGPCGVDDHACVDGLTCQAGASGLLCSNSNIDADATGALKTAFSFNLANYCPAPDLNHEWPGSHEEANFKHPMQTLRSSPNDGFVRVNDATEQIDHGESPTEDETMGYYDQVDLPFYYGVAQTFAISDRYFSSLIGPTFPNRAYSFAATSFGHLTTAEIVPPPNPPAGGYRPIHGTILDRLDQNGVGWIDFVSNVPSTAIFRGADPAAGHLAPVSALALFAQPKAVPQGQCLLPPVSYIDSFFEGFGDPALESDEHPPSSIKKGESFVSQVVNTIRDSWCWDSSVIFITYDEHGGFYDHVAPPPAPQGGAKNPDGVDPGLCEDASAPPASEQPGGGQQCTASFKDAHALCPGLVRPTGPYPPACPNFDQLGFRVPFMAVSPFSKPQYVSHVVADHTSMLAFIEKRFGLQPLTARDQNASTLEDLFDFDNAPSQGAPVPAPENDARCTQTGP
jgi:phospholipase C